MKGSTMDSNVNAIVAFEFSGVVRDALNARDGVTAVSVDLLPTESPGPHYTGDIHEFLDAVDMARVDLVIAHPPCTYLSQSGVWCLHAEPTGNGVPKGIERWIEMIDAAVLFRSMLELPVPHIAVENPVMHGYAKKIIGEGFTQTVQPWQFGHPEKKRTGFTLKGLPPLESTNDVSEEMAKLSEYEQQRVLNMSPGPNRQKERSRTYPGIAAAMADQWVDHIIRSRQEQS